MAIRKGKLNSKKVESAKKETTPRPFPRMHDNLKIIKERQLWLVLIAYILKGPDVKTYKIRIRNSILKTP